MDLLDVVIDVSDAQGVIDWPAVADAGVRVAFVKASEDASFSAHYWHVNKREAEKAGLKVIPYHFVGRANFEEQALHFRDVAELAPGLAYALDWEGHRTATAEEVEMLGDVLAEITGRTPLGYWGIRGSTPAPPTAAMQRWERWVPRYPLRDISDFQQLPDGHRSPGVAYLFWQYTSRGLVAGIHGFVDRSIASFDDIEELVRWCEEGPRIA